MFKSKSKLVIFAVVIFILCMMPIASAAPEIYILENFDTIAIGSIPSGLVDVSASPPAQGVRYINGNPALVLDANSGGQNEGIAAIITPISDKAGFELSCDFNIAIRGGTSIFCIGDADNYIGIAIDDSGEIFDYNGWMTSIQPPGTISENTQYSLRMIYDSANSSYHAYINDSRISPDSGLTILNTFFSNGVCINSAFTTQNLLITDNVVFKGLYASTSRVPNPKTGYYSINYIWIILSTILALTIALFAKRKISK